METKTRAEIFGENLVRIMQEKGISRKELATALGVSIPAVFTYIHGVKQPTLDKIFNIADFLKVPVVNLLGDNDYNFSYPNIDEIIFEYRYSRVLKLAIAANIDIQKFSNGFIISLPSTFQHIENDGTISVISGIETYKIKDKFSLVEIVEQSETQAIKLNKPFLEVFKDRMTAAK